MSASKDFNKYRAKWQPLFDWIVEHPDKDLVVTCPTDKNAQSMRFEFYRARRAAERDPVLRVGYGTELDNRHVTLQGNVVTFRVGSSSPLAQVLQDAIAKADAALKDHK